MTVPGSQAAGPLPQLPRELKRDIPQPPRVQPEPSFSLLTATIKCSELLQWSTGRKIQNATHSTECVTHVPGACCHSSCCDMTQRGSANTRLLQEHTQAQLRSSSTELAAIYCIMCSKGPWEQRRSILQSCIPPPRRL